MKLKSVGEIIATRDLKLGDKAVSVIIGRPEKFPDGKDYYCPFQIVGMGSEHVKYVGGVDSIQALMLCLKIVGVDLYTSVAVMEGLVTWDAGNELGDLGFPKIK